MRNAARVLDLDVGTLERQPHRTADRLQAGRHLLVDDVLVVDPRHRGEEPGKPAPVLVAAGTPAAERGGVVVDEVVGDVGGDLLGIGAVERGEIGPNDPGRA